MSISYANRPSIGAHQKVVPQSLRERVIVLSLKPVNPGYVGESCLFQTMRTKLYWPFIASYLTHHVKHFCTCVIEKGLRFTRPYKLKIFPPCGQLQDIAMNILGLLANTKNDYLHVVFITDRYRKLTRAIPMQTSLLLPAVVINNWIIRYEI